MTIQERATTFVRLGLYLQQLASAEKNEDEDVKLNELYFENAQELIKIVHLQNGWFTEANVRFALHSIAQMLNEVQLNEWISKYNFPNTNVHPKKVGLVLAGNIPLVGFHDFLSVLITGNIAIVKLSSDDKVLLPFVFKILCSIETRFSDQVIFTENRLNDSEAVIATGSGNTARYFDYYFSKVPNIIRKNRSSVAVLDGSENNDELKKLGEDIFTYFGLGCRNVSKLFLPEGYDLNTFFTAIYPFNTIINHNKYANNFDYNRAVYLMGKDKDGLLENGFLFLVKSEAYASPVAVLFYEYYSNKEQVAYRLNDAKDKIQCIVTHLDFNQPKVAFGNTQHPALWDYADDVDTIKFLLALN